MDADELGESKALKYNVFVIKGRKKEQVNKNPLSKKDAEALMYDYKKSGIKHDSLDIEELYSNEKKLKAIRKKGNIITFKKPFYPFGTNGRSYQQIISKGIEKAKNGSIKIIGSAFDTPWYKSIDELFAAIDWEFMKGTIK